MVVRASCRQAARLPPTAVPRSSRRRIASSDAASAIASAAAASFMLDKPLDAAATLVAELLLAPIVRAAARFHDALRLSLQKVQDLRAAERPAKRNGSVRSGTVKRETPLCQVAQANLGCRLSEAFALCHFFCRPAARPAPCGSLRPPSGRSARSARTLNFQNEGRISLRRCAANPGRAGPRPERRQPVSEGRGGESGRTTAAVIPCRAARPGQPATACAFRPQAAERHRHHGHEAEPQAHLLQAGSASP